MMEFFWDRALPARKNTIVLILGLVLAVLLAGCSNKQVYGDLSEEHANEMIAVLNEAGVAAEKSSVAEGKWRVSVAEGDMPTAFATLRANGLPKPKLESACTVFKKEGIASSPIEERARLNCAKSQELEGAIGKIEGVLTASVLLSMPEADPLSRVAQPSGASVYIKYRTGYDMRSKQGAIKTLVGNSVEGLNYDRVSVFMEPAQSIPVAKRQNDGLPWGDVVRILLGIIAVALLAIAGRAWLRGRKPKNLVRADP